MRHRRWNSTEERKRHLERLIQQQDVDIKRLWRRLPIAPQSFAGEGRPGGPVPTAESGTEPGDGSGSLSEVISGSPISSEIISGSGTCPRCETFPFAWQFTVSGVSNNACFTCGNFNGTFRLEHVSGCKWESTVDAYNCTAGQCSNRAMWEFSWSDSFSPRGWRLVARMAPAAFPPPMCLQLDEAAVFDIANDQFDCLGGNTLNIKTNTSGSLDPNQPNFCQGWPATVALTPA